jgi:hypothetical protein
MPGPLPRVFLWVEGGDQGRDGQSACTSYDIALLTYFTQVWEMTSTPWRSKRRTRRPDRYRGSSVAKGMDSGNTYVMLLLPQRGGGPRRKKIASHIIFSP